MRALVPVDPYFEWAILKSIIIMCMLCWMSNFVRKVKTFLAALDDEVLQFCTGASI